MSRRATTFIPEWDPDTIRPTDFIPFYGRRESGKTNLMRYLLARHATGKKKDGRLWDVVNVICPSPAFIKWAEVVPFSFVRGNYTHAITRELIEPRRNEYVEKAAESNDPDLIPRLILCDDLSYARKLVRSDEVIQQEAANGRHWRDGLWMSAQFPTHLPPDCRTAADKAFIMGEMGENQLELLYREYGMRMGFKTFLAMYDECVKKRGDAMVIDRYAGKDSRTKIFHFNCGPSHTWPKEYQDFAAGSPQVWKWHFENKEDDRKAWLKRELLGLQRNKQLTFKKDYPVFSIEKTRRGQ